MFEISKKVLQVLFVFFCVVHVVLGQEMDCYGPGSIAGAVIGTFIVTLVLLCIAFYGYKLFMKNKREKHLVLETDPETGDKYAFDNPCFKDGTPAGLTPIAKALDKSGSKLLDTGKKWHQWSPLGALISTKNEKKRTLDDSYLERSEIKTVSLRSHDFTGLGFNICGNMRDGIFIKDVLHRGPASESGKLSSGDRINSVRISFENMVYEDALKILSYASPYEVEVEAKSVPKGLHHGPPGSGGQGAEPKHPLYRSRSSSDLVKIGKTARQRLFLNGDTLDTSLTTDYSTLPYSSNNTTLERTQKSPKTDVNSLTKPERTKKSSTTKNLTPEQLKTQLEQNLSQKITTPADQNKTEAEKQTSEVDKDKNRFQKFGVKVLPMDSKPEQQQQPAGSPKSSELSQNDNNINQERQENGLPEGVDEVDKKLLNGKVEENKEAPPVKRREKTKVETPTETPVEPEFNRESILNDSGIKRDKSGIPQEIPEHMLQAANAARKNRKSQEVLEKIEIPESDNNEQSKTPKKQKGKAPAPPPAVSTTPLQEQDKPVATKLNFTENFDEISTLEEEKEENIKKPSVETQNEDNSTEIKTENNSETKEYNSDSDMETDNQSSVNTIELNSSDITIHHAEQNNESIKGRKTASTGDLSKIQKEKKSNTGTLERAQSLDITDSGIPTLTKKRKATKDDLDSKLSSDDSLYETTGLKVKEPRLSLALDGLDTFQRNRLKKSSEWGNLEDVILNLDKVDADIPETTPIPDEIKTEFIETSPIKFDFGSKDVPFGTSVTTLSDIHLTLVDDDGITNDVEITEVKNIIWPSSKSDSNISDDNIPIDNKPQIVDKQDKIQSEIIETTNKNIHNILWPVSESDKAINDLDETKTEIKPIPSQKPTLVDTVPSFSLKDTFQEKLNNKLQSNEPVTTGVTSATTISTVFTVKPSENSTFNPGKSSKNFIFAEKCAYDFPNTYDTNISDDIKVSRHSLGSLERPKSDVLKNVNKLKMQNLISSDQGGVSNVTVTENNDYQTKKTTTEIIPETYDMSTASELYTTANDITLQDDKPESDRVYASPEIKNITITESITDNKYLTDSPSSLTIDTSSDGPDSIKSNTLTFVTEIQVSTPTNPEIKSPNSSPESHQKKPEENIKKLPEMKFTTSSYEAPKTPEKRISQIELLRSNFEKSPPKSKIEISPSKSRIPVATKIDFKSPDRKIGEVDEEIVEIMSSAAHSTPLAINQKNPNKTTARNVTVTSIRTSSKIPSGSSNYSNKPPVPARPDSEHHSNGDTTFKQWVFNPNENSITNIVVNNNKERLNN